MQIQRVGIVGAGPEGVALLKTLKNYNHIKVKGIVDLDGKALELSHLEQEQIRCYPSVESMLAQDYFDIILALLRDPGATRELRRQVPEATALVEAPAVEIMMAALGQREEMLEINKVKEQLATILNTAQEGIQMVDREGKILFINRGYTRITGIGARDRIGKSVFDVSPGGALAQVLRTGKPCSRRRNKVVGSNAEVISNAAPIIVDQEMVGAVVVFQDITEVIRLTEELRRSTSMIHDLKHEIHQLHEGRGRFEHIICQSEKMQNLISIAKRAAWETSPILISGETGTGKDTIANAVHFESPKSREALIKVNCAALPPDLMEIELFGCEAGAFPGVNHIKVGKFELASGGNIFLDEIGEAGPQIQAKLLRCLQERSIQRVGGTESVPVDVRIICSTSRNLPKLIDQGRFREDLFFRINVINLHIPPLRERREDILALAEVYIKHFNGKFFKNVRGLTDKARFLLTTYRWPGNVRELINILERAVLVAEGEWITEDLLGPYFYRYRETSMSPEGVMTLSDMEKRLIFLALEEYGDDLEGKRRAAKALGISLATLYNKIKRYNIK